MHRQNRIGAWKLTQDWKSCQCRSKAISIGDPKFTFNKTQRGWKEACYNLLRNRKSRTGRLWNCNEWIHFLVLWQINFLTSLNWRCESNTLTYDKTNNDTDQVVRSRHDFQSFLQLWLRCQHERKQRHTYFFFSPSTYERAKIEISISHSSSSNCSWCRFAQAQKMTKRSVSNQKHWPVLTIQIWLTLVAQIWITKGFQSFMVFLVLWQLFCFSFKDQNLRHCLWQIWMMFI